LSRFRLRGRPGERLMAIWAAISRPRRRSGAISAWRARRPRPHRAVRLRSTR